ncbi:MAG: hypothetical protein U0X20_02850 [Caldilineaceae bacterium]
MQKQQLRARFWVELVIAAVNIVLFTATILWPEWIELVFRVEPDAGSGALEWAIAGATLVISIVCLILMRVEWRRVAAQPS